MISVERWEKIRADLEKFIGVRISKRKIRLIEVNPRIRSIPKTVIQVGKKHRGLEPGSPLEEVIAIYESTLFCVCTDSRGIDGTPPYYFLREDVIRVEEEP